MVQPEREETTGSVAKYTERLSLCQSHLGQVLRLLGEYDQADEAFRTAVATLSACQPLPPDNEDRLRFHLLSLGNPPGAAGKTQGGSARDESGPDDLGAAGGSRGSGARTSLPLGPVVSRLPRAAVPQRGPGGHGRPQADRRSGQQRRVLEHPGTGSISGGDWQAAAESLQRAIQTRPAEHRLGLVRPDDGPLAAGRSGGGSKSYIAAEIEWMEKTLPYDERLVRTRDEAKGLLGVPTD